MRYIITNKMGVTKTEIFTEQQNSLATTLKALAHPARIAILQYIIKQNACICNDLVEELGLAQATISQHLKELKNAGIIKGNISGNSICYCIDEKAIEILNTYFLNIIQNLSKSKCC